MVIVRLVLSKVNFLMGLCFQITIDELEQGLRGVISCRKVTGLARFSTSLWKTNFGTFDHKIESRNGPEEALRAGILRLSLPDSRLGTLKSNLTMRPVTKRF
jgi:hypothetical protein